MRWLLLSIAVLLSTGLQANPDAQAVVREASVELLDRLRAENVGTLSSNEIRSLVEATVTRHVDFDRFSRFVLGKHWKRSTPDQRTRFVAAFRQLVVRTYTAALEGSQVTDIRFPAPGNSGKDGRAVIPTVIELAGSPSIQVNYRMYMKDAEWKIYDVLIEGISMTVNYRTEFSRSISNDGVAGLIQSLETRYRRTASTS